LNPIPFLAECSGLIRTDTSIGGKSAIGGIAQSKQRKTIDPSVKLEVVRMVKEQGLSVGHVSQSIDVGQTAIRRWLMQYEAEVNGKPGIGNQELNPANTLVAIVPVRSRGTAGGQSRHLLPWYREERSIQTK
jgi:transposase-like protein